MLDIKLIRENPEKINELLKRRNPALSVAPTLQNYYVKFFSNDPAFVYTYAHTFMEKEIFVDELKDRMSKIAVKKAAEIRRKTKRT